MEVDFNLCQNFEVMNLSDNSYPRARIFGNKEGKSYNLEATVIHRGIESTTRCKCYIRLKRN